MQKECINPAQTACLICFSAVHCFNTSSSCKVHRVYSSSISSCKSTHNIWEHRGHLPVCEFCYGIQENFTFQLYPLPLRLIRPRNRRHFLQLLCKSWERRHGVQKKQSNCASQKKKKKKSNQIVLQNQMLVQENCIFRMGFPLVIFIWIII